MGFIFAALDPNLKWYLTLIVLVVALAIGTVLAYRVTRDLKEAEEPSGSPDDLLGPLAEAFAAGQMSEEEYQRIRESVSRTGAPTPPIKPNPLPKTPEPGTSPPTAPEDVPPPVAPPEGTV